MMNLIALLLVLTGTANIDASSYLHQEILIIRHYNNNNDGLKKVKFIYSEKATKFCEISIFYLPYLVTVKSTVEISQNFVAFSEYMNFKCI